MSSLPLLQDGAAVGVWELDPATSVLEFRVKHFWGAVNVRGRLAQSRDTSTSLPLGRCPEASRHNRHHSRAGMASEISTFDPRTSSTSRTIPRWCFRLVMSIRLATQGFASLAI